MFGPVRAILVDDKPRHLIAISTGLASAQIPCMPYWYDRSEIQLSKKLKPSPPKAGHPYARIIFTDLNLEEVTSQELANVISPAVSVIKQLIRHDTGPYVVIFWTVMHFNIADIRAELMSRLESNEVPLPLAIDELAKGDFVTSEETNEQGDAVLEAIYRTLHRRSLALRDEIERILRKHGLLRMLSGWESRAISAAGDAIRLLHSTALLGKLPDEKLEDSMAKIAALVSREAVGTPNASEDPASAFDAAMLDVLSDAFGRSVRTFDYSDLVKSLLTPIMKDEFEFSDRIRVNAELNTIQHLDTEPLSNGAVQRGQIIRLDEAIEAGFPLKLDEICCWGDFFFEPRRKDPAGSQLTQVSEQTVNRFREIVRGLDNNADAIVNKAIALCRKDRNSELNDSYQSLLEGKPEFEAAVEWVLIEAGAACDHSQRKNRTVRYLVGVTIPTNSAANYAWTGSAKHRKLKNEALRLLGPLTIDDQVKYLLVSLKRFVVWQQPDQAVLSNPYLRLRNSTVDYLLSCYATWSARPGIIEFN